MERAFFILLAAAVLSPLLVRQGRFAPLLALAPAAALGYVHAGPMEVSYPWVPSLGVAWSLRADGLSLLFADLVLGIGALVVLYASSYLRHHRDFPRFFPILFLFMGSMLGLVLADDAVTLFVFWEGTSLTSYLLIGFDHEKPEARVAARKAFLITGAGGLALLGGFILLHHVTGTWSVSSWIEMRAEISAHPLAPWALGLIILGAFTKSAQFPFHFWLPAAMAGPTPVSAYLHSATMVKAGVFLLARMTPLGAGFWGWKLALVAAGGITMLLSAWTALRETDLKAILAQTTTMALGLLVLLLGLGTEHAVMAAMTYLLVHAFYKGALFMTAGNVDHGAHTRELGELSGLKGAMPVTALATGLACLSMAGLPPFFGFVGKEASYEAALHWSGLAGWTVLAVSVAANVALFCVAIVLMVKPFFGAPSSAAKHAHEADAEALVGPLVLAGLGLSLGLEPGLAERWVFGAGSAVLASPVSGHLALWHGVNPAFVASLLTFGAGFGLYLTASTLRRSAGFREVLALYADLPGRWFELGLFSVTRAAQMVENVLYPGRLRTYVFNTLLALVLLGGVMVGVHGGLAWPALTEIRPHEAVLIVILVVTSGLAAFVEPAMKAIISVGISGYCVALIYLLFGAPDVAMTQFAIETLTVILVVLTLLHLPSAAYERSRSRRAWLDASLVFAASGLVTAVLLSVLARPLSLRVSDWYLAHSVPDAHGHNVVNVILVDFRGFDTWGEITVLTIAGLGVYALLRRQARKGTS